MPLGSVLNDPYNVVVDILDLTVLPDRGLNVLHHLDPSHVVHQAGHSTILHSADSSNSARTMNVVCWVERTIIVDHVTETKC